MRRLVVALAILLVPSMALARSHGAPGGSSGGKAGGMHMSGGWSGAKSGGWSHHGPSSMAVGPRRNSAARVSGLSSGTGNWKGGNWQGGKWSHNGHHHHHHHHNRVFFVGGGPWWWGDYGYYDNAYYDDGCWQWIETRRGLRRVWACSDYY
jgi:hypothetical protein